MSGGEGVRNPTDLTPVLNMLFGIEWWLAFGFNQVLAGLDDIDDQLDDVDAAIEANRLLLLVIQAGVAEVLVDTAAIIATLVVIDNEIAVIDGIVDTILIDTTAIAADVAGLDGAAMRGTDNAALAVAWTAALATALANYTAVRAGYLDQLDFALQEAIAAIPTTAMRGTDDAATEAKQDIIDANVDDIETLVDSKVMGKVQIEVYPLDLDSTDVGSYATLIGTDADIIIESLIFYCKRDLSGDAGFTGLSVETDDTTTQTFITQGNGIKANLTAESQLAWTGAILLREGQYIQFSIYGGAVANLESLCEIVIKFRAVESGGYLV